MHEALCSISDNTKTKTNEISDFFYQIFRWAVYKSSPKFNKIISFLLHSCSKTEKGAFIFILNEKQYPQSL